MSKHDDKDPGTLTRDDLTEAIRVNRALERAALSDIEYRDHRVARCRELIAEQEMMIANHLDDANTAPIRLVRIRARVEQQEKALAALERVAPSRTRTQAGLSTADREIRVAALSARLAKGDQTALPELLKLARG